MPQRLMILMACALTATSLHGQSTAPDPWGFVVARLSSSQVNLVYAGLGYRGPFAMMALVQNPRGGYTESLGGVGDRFMIDSIPQVAAVAEAKATDSWYTQLYYLPQVNVGPVKLASTFEMYLPNQRAGTVQLVLAPASVYVSLTHTVGLGVLYQAAFEPNHAPHDGLGPAVSIAIPHGTLELGFLRGISDFTDEVRAQVTITY